MLKFILSLCLLPIFLQAGSAEEYYKEAIEAEKAGQRDELFEKARKAANTTKKTRKIIKPSSD